MSKKTLIWVIIFWVILTLFNYYYMNFFFLALELIGLVLLLFTITLIQFVKLLKERKTISKLRIQKFSVFLVLFLLTVFRFYTNQIIEKIDWIILKNKRTEIVEKVKTKELKPNVSWNGILCQLPFEFPVVSNGGNDILIFSNKENKSIEVDFFVFANFFDSPSTKFIYTNDIERIKIFEKKIKENPTENWKIENNWYRIYGE